MSPSTIDRPSLFTVAGSPDMADIVDRHITRRQPTLDQIVTVGIDLGARPDLTAVVARTRLAGNSVNFIIYDEIQRDAEGMKTLLQNLIEEPPSLLPTRAKRRAARRRSKTKQRGLRP